MNVTLNPWQMQNFTNCCQMYEVRAMLLRSRLEAPHMSGESLERQSDLGPRDNHGNPNRQKDCRIGQNSQSDLGANEKKKTLEYYSQCEPSEVIAGKALKE